MGLFVFFELLIHFEKFISSDGSWPFTSIGLICSFGLFVCLDLFLSFGWFTRIGSPLPFLGYFFGFFHSGQFLNLRLSVSFGRFSHLELFTYFELFVYLSLVR